MSRDGAPVTEKLKEAEASDVKGSGKKPPSPTKKKGPPKPEVMSSCFQTLKIHKGILQWRRMTLLN